jgi:hypothetical protein
MLSSSRPGNASSASTRDESVYQCNLRMDTTVQLAGRLRYLDGPNWIERCRRLTGMAHQRRSSVPGRSSLRSGHCQRPGSHRPSGIS